MSTPVVARCNNNTGTEVVGIAKVTIASVARISSLVFTSICTEACIVVVLILD